MTRVRLVTYAGVMDGVRYGTMSFSGLLRQFRWDRLTRKLRLYTDQQELELIVDEDPDHVSAAMAVLLEREPVPEGVGWP